MTLIIKQRGVLRGIVVGATITLVVLAVAILTNPVQLPAETSTGDRIGFALATDVVIALWLAVSVGLLAHHRFFTAEDIDGSGLTQGTQRAQILQANLQNTLEQTVLAVLVHSMWAATMPLSWISAVPAAAILFLCGRVLFVRGYSGGAPSRALGFALTFLPSVLMGIIVVVGLIASGFTSARGS
jgi:uncharacterized membrane protein YecN with MAPEG domain